MMKCMHVGLASQAGHGFGRQEMCQTQLEWRWWTSNFWVRVSLRFTVSLQVRMASLRLTVSLRVTVSLRLAISLWVLMVVCD